MLKRSSKSKGGQQPVAFKLKAIKRVERGEGVSPVARDLDMTRTAPARSRGILLKAQANDDFPVKEEPTPPSETR